MKKPLIFFHRLVAKSEVAALAEACILRKIKPIIICGSPQLANELDQKIHQNAEVLLSNGKHAGLKVKNENLAYAAKMNQTKKSFKVSLKKLLLKSNILKALFLIRTLQVASKNFLKFCQLYNPTSIIIFDDRAPKEMLYIKKANEQGIHSILVPFAASSVESCVFLRRDKPLYYVDKEWSCYLKKYIAYLYPSQVLATEYGRMFLFSPWETFILGTWNLLTNTNWHHGGGQAKFNCLMGKGEETELLEAAIHSERIIVTGQPSLDIIYRNQQNNILHLKQLFVSKFKLNEQKPVIICAVPHYAEHNIFEKEEHNKLTETLFSALGNCAGETLLSLHPKSKKADYKAMADKYNLHVLDAPLTDALVAADIFISGYSSTVRWSAILGIPTIIADLGKLYYQIYEALPSLNIVFDKPELRQVLNQLVSDKIRRDKLSVTLAEEATQIGIIDGNACDKIIELM